MKRIRVLADANAISPQARTYAEYRVFSALTRDAIDFRHARVWLRTRARSGTHDKVSCAVTVALAPSGAIRVSATGSRAYAAIDRAVERLGSARRHDSINGVRPDVLAPHS
jgi:ribosome-associated translation inhibitor RaiA